MVTQSKLLFLFLILAITLVSCKKDPEVISGCTDPLGDTYNPDASIDNGSCTYQKRFLGNYNGEFKCKGVFATVFNMALVHVTELIKKDEVNIIIESAIGPLPVMGKLTKSEIIVDATLPNIKVRIGDVIPGGGDTQVLCDGKVKTILAISADNKILTGSLKIDLITKEPALINGIFSIPAGYTLSDECDFKGTKI
ncbi:MAG: hypothetical protein IPO98_21665 [Saprospiraceae bacterium]|nr:hypothetical protein [Saprospiraceae bacterium]